VKLVREHINEKFTDDDSDPIHDMGIGLYIKRDFNSSEEYAEFMIKFLPAILGEKEIPKDFLFSDHFYFNPKYDEKIEPYSTEYVRIKNEHIKNYDNMILYKMLMKMGFKTK
jgi:hypothetical protein